MSNLRVAVATLLLADTATLVPLLPGGIYPTSASGVGDVEKIERKGPTEAAFLATGDIQPCAIVAEEAATPFGPHPTSFMGFIRVYLYQQRGRDVIDAAQVIVTQLVVAQRRVLVGERYRTLRFAGYGPSGAKDSALRGASVGWVRFQANGLVTLP